jgi:hypothetical protein
VILYGKNFAIDCVDTRKDCDAFKDAVGGDLG